MAGSEFSLIVSSVDVTTFGSGFSVSGFSAGAGTSSLGVVSLWIEGDRGVAADAWGKLFMFSSFGLPV